MQGRENIFNRSHKSYERSTFQVDLSNSLFVFKFLCHYSI